MSHHTDEHERLHSLLLEASLKHFEAVGLRARHLQHCPADAELVQNVAGLIAFSNEHVRGTMAFRAPYLVPEQSHPLLASGPLASADVQDWMGELTNGLLGRFKNLCATQGLEFSVGIPRVVVGNNMGVTRLRGAMSDVIHFECNEMPVDVSIDLVLDADIALFGACSEQVLEEGGMLVF